MRSVDDGSIRESSGRAYNGVQEFEVRVPIDLYDVGGNRFHHRRARHNESIDFRQQRKCVWANRLAAPVARTHRPLQNASELYSANPPKLPGVAISAVSMLVASLRTGLPGVDLGATPQPVPAGANQRREMTYGAGSMVSIPDLMGALTKFIWTESWGSTSRNTSTTRRELQRSYHDQMSRLLMQPADGTPTDARSVARMQLKDLNRRLGAALAAGTKPTPTASSRRRSCERRTPSQARKSREVTIGGDELRTGGSSRSPCGRRVRDR